MSNLQQLEQEVWKDIPDYEGLYQVSTLGNVRSLDKMIFRRNCINGYLIKGRVLSFVYDAFGYRYVTLYSKNKNKQPMGVHRIVFKAFYPELSTKGFEIDHIDNNKINNCPSNLQLLKPRYNSSKRSMNLKKSSRFTGVSWTKDKEKWQAHIRYNGKSYYLGRFDDEFDAAAAYQNALKEIECGTFNKEIHKQASNYLGVTFDKSHNKWRAIYKRKYLGLFQTEEEAHQAYQQALKQFDTA